MDWAHLATWIRADSATLYSTHVELAEHASLSVRTIEDLTAGRRTRYRASTLHRIEAALGWEHGSVDRVIGGGRPRYVKDPMLAELERIWPHLSRDARIIILRLARDARG